MKRIKKKKGTTYSTDTIQVFILHPIQNSPSHSIGRDLIIVGGVSRIVQVRPRFARPRPGLIEGVNVEGPPNFVRTHSLKQGASKRIRL